MFLNSFHFLHMNSMFLLTITSLLQSTSLKTALLDYIKRCLPADSEKYNMVALCFSMRREIGENHEMAARTQLKMIESQAWGELLSTRMQKDLSTLLHPV